jgi:hypothetical protein
MPRRPLRWAARPASLALAVLLAMPAAAQQLRAEVEFTQSGALLQDGVTLTPRDFFLLAGRTDLVERSDRNLLARRWLFVSAAAVLLAVVVVGSVILALTPKIEKPYCLSSFARFSECSDYESLYARGGVATMIVGVPLAGLLAALGWWQSPDVLSRRDLAPVVDAYNAGLQGPR